MKYNINNLFTFNDLSIDRKNYKRKVVPIPNSLWSIDNKGAVYNSYGEVAAYDPIWDGSPRVRVNYNGEQVYKYVNDLVLTCFKGEPPSSNHRPWHCDGDRENCYLDNLSWQIIKEERTYE